MTIQLANDVAARAPISRSPSGSWACHAASKRPSALGEPVKTPRSPVSASWRALDAWQEAKTRAAADVSAALSWTTAASSSRRSRSAAASEREAACSKAQAEAPASPSVGTGSSGLLELAGQCLVWTERRRDPMGQPGATGDELGGTRVQCSSARRTEIGVNGGPVQRMGKGQLRCQSAFAQESGRHRRIDRLLGIGQLSDRQRSLTRAHDAPAPKLPPRMPGLAAESPATRARITAESSRGAGRALSSPFNPGDPDLIEQRPAVESVSFGVRSQSSCRSLRQRPKPQRARQLDEILTRSDRPVGHG